MMQNVASHIRPVDATWPHPADPHPDRADLAASRMREALRLLDSIGESIAAAHLQHALDILER